MNQNKDVLWFKFLLFAAYVLTGLPAGGHVDRYDIQVVFAAIGLIFTFFAAPVMMSIRTMGNNEIPLQKAFDQYQCRGLLRAIAQLCSFLACVWVFTKNVFKVKTL